MYRSLPQPCNNSLVGWMKPWLPCPLLRVDRLVAALLPGGTWRNQFQFQDRMQLYNVRRCPNLPVVTIKESNSSYPYHNWLICRVRLSEDLIQHLTCLRELGAQARRAGPAASRIRNLNHHASALILKAKDYEMDIAIRLIPISAQISIDLIRREFRWPDSGIWRRVSRPL